ncbi:MAG TPA: ABC transporter substrate-binding protein, partial [Bacteroidia bacterium]|nr:ABC transporter substrate-binding protein [Bacteroidia bacterium]
VKPCIASRWDISDDGLSYTFHLRTDVYFHTSDVFEGGTGRKATAGDFVYSFERLFDKSTSRASDLLEYFDRSPEEGKKGFTALNDSTFQIQIRNPFPAFLGILTMKFFSVVPHEAVEHYGADFARHPVGTGPFSFRIWKEGQKLLLVKNPGYFEKENGHALPYLDAVSVSFIHDRESAWLDFQKHNLDMISGFDAFNAREVLTPNGELKSLYKNSFMLQSQPFLKTDYLGFLDDVSSDPKPNPFRNKALRQAINYGIDREKMITYLRNHVGTSAINGFVPPGLPGYDNSKVEGYTYNPEKAKQLIYLAGYPEGKGLPEINLYTTKQYLDLAEHLRFQLAQIGVKILINVVEDGAFREGVANSKMNFFRKSWVGDFPDPINFLALFYGGNFSPNGYNYTHFRNAHYDNLYKQALVEKNDSLRKTYYYDMERILIDEAPVVPLYHDRVVRLVQNNVAGLTVNSMNMLNLKTVKKID